MQRIILLTTLGFVSIIMIACTSPSTYRNTNIGNTIDYSQFQQMASNGDIDRLKNSETICFFARALYPNGESSYPGIEEKDLEYLTTENTIFVRVIGKIEKNKEGKYVIESKVDTKSLEEQMRRFNQNKILKLKRHIKTVLTTPRGAPLSA